MVTQSPVKSATNKGSGIMRMKLGLVSLQLLACTSLATPAFAQTVADSASSPQASSSDVLSAGSDIVVTARRRNETSLQAPVVLTAFSGEQLSRLAVQNVIDLGKMTPMLTIGAASGSYGSIIGLRGASGSTSNAASEGAVTVTVDGVPVSNGPIVRLSSFDVGQVEVLKGPQALFFGKNASGGIISIRTAEPTSVFKAQISGGYEFNARQGDVDGYVSGPISDTLTARVSGHFSRQRGYFQNLATNPAFRFAPGTKEEAGRLSLNWEPNDQLTVKLRGTLHHVRDNGGYSINQKFACRTPGAPQTTGAVVAGSGDTDCVADGYNRLAAMPSARIRAVTGNPFFDSDYNYFRATQYLLSSEIEYKVNDSITLSSITGYYHVNQAAVDSTTQGDKLYIMDQGRSRKRTFSEELRVSYRNPDVPINLMFGGFFQDDRLTFQQQVVNNIFGSATVYDIRLSSNSWTFPNHNRTYSAFGQVGWDITKAFSLSAGVRFSEDKKRLSVTPPAGLPNKIARPFRDFQNWSPEVTLAYKPTPDFNLFGSYKQGFKAGAFNLGATTAQGPTANPNVTSFDLSYEPETASGFEVGLKTLLMDRQVRLNLAAYSYLYSNLQLSRVDPVTLALAALNASSARIKGVEGDITFSPRTVPGLTLMGSAAYNSARYNSSFLGPCFTGQTPTQGCFPTTIGTATVNVQEFNGRPLPRAPEFSGSVGIAYETPVSADWIATFNANGVYTSSQYISQELSPIGRTPARFLLDGSLSFGPKSKSMEFAIIGRNLTDKHFGVTGFGSFGTGSGTATAGGAISDYEGPVSRGREIWLKVTLRPSEF